MLVKLAKAFGLEDERALRRLLQLRDEDPPHRALPLRQPHVPQRLHLPRDPEVRQDPAGHEMHTVAEGRNQICQCRRKLNHSENFWLVFLIMWLK